ncbi:hypothetical protein [Nocardioides sp. Soil796]|uniref:hypothetical protein n=1 Tax=Nocardioides sp. Soil796 TaxID=1736412 RepID=UPI000708CABD|nr:hypothetical protein [Nocardioides sp. Soil796]KRF11018.1 hypothetical protein ASH02_19470 [Nocardioides sp. Soil796]
MSLHSSLIAQGRWYYTVTVATAGIGAWIPFVHASSRLNEPGLRRNAVAYGAGALVLLGLSAVTPTDANGDPQGTFGGVLSTVMAILAIVMIVMACLQLRAPRQAVYPAPYHPHQGFVDPAVGNALAARNRRDEARRLVASDPSLARELIIGRPDYKRTYHDGGLIDLNNAPRGTLTSFLGITDEAAGRIVAQRELLSRGFSSIEEAIVFSDQTGADADILRDRGVLLPR